MSSKFKCGECGSKNLALCRYAKCYIPVVIKNGTCEYLEAEVDIDDYIDAEDYFCCLDCEEFIGDREYRLQTEEELLEYLNCKVVSQKKIVKN